MVQERRRPVQGDSFHKKELSKNRGSRLTELFRQPQFSPHGMIRGRSDRGGQGQSLRHDALMVLFAYRHGLRAAEVVDLRWEQVDFKMAHLSVRKVKAGHSQQPSSDGPGIARVEAASAREQRLTLRVRF